MPLHSCSSASETIEFTDMREIKRSSFSQQTVAPPDSVGSLRFAMMLHAMLAADPTKYLPGSAMHRTRISRGKCFSSAALTCTAMSGMARGSVTSPGNPPPMSKSPNAYPCVDATLKASRAHAMGSAKAEASKQPLPTWKLTPITFMFSDRARLRMPSTSSSGAPNFSRN